MKILVTGVAGAIGSHLAERLIKEGHQVVGVDSLTSYYSPQIKKINAEDVREAGAQIVFKDLTKDSLKDELKGVDVIFHCAAQPGISATTPFAHYLDNNIIATWKLLEEAKNISNLKAFIFASTSSVYGTRANGDETTEPKPTSFYGVTKLSAEQLALSYYRELGIPVISLRFFSVFGERERPEKLFHKLIKAMCEDTEFPLFQGSEHHIRSYTYISDIIDGCILALNNLEKSVGEIFNLGNDKTNTTGEGIKIIEDIFSNKAKLKIIPRRPGDQFETAANIEKARKILGYNPQIGLRDGLEAQVRWYKEKIFNKLK